MKIFQKAFVAPALMVLVLAALLSWTPLWNGYPLLRADSGTYIWSSVIFLVPQDRQLNWLEQGGGRTARDCLGRDRVLLAKDSGQQCARNVDDFGAS